MQWMIGMIGGVFDGLVLAIWYDKLHIDWPQKMFSCTHHMFATV